MADQFQAGSCSSGSWWSTPTTGGFVVVDGAGPTMSASASCSTELTANIGAAAGSFNWATAAADVFEAKSRSCDESPVSISNSSISFQDNGQNSQASAPVITAPMLEMDFGLSSPTTEWSQPFFSSSSSGGAENSFHALLQQDVISRPYAQRDSGVELSPSKNMNRSNFLQDHHVLSSGVNSIPLLNSAASCGLPNSMLLQSVLEPDSRLQRSFYDAQMMKYRPSIDYNEASNDQSLQASLVNKLPQFMKASVVPPKQQLQFSNDTSFWNPSASGVIGSAAAHTNARPPQLVQNENSNYSNLVVKTIAPGVRSSCSNLEKRSGASDPALKKPRIETPSPLPTFKVRKEKLGDRITALQQLVSPFGKTDTASVLHEAIEYIKFLHDQVRVLSAPYLKNDPQAQQTKNLEKSKDCEGQDEDLRSRGLCLVPISSTFAVANEIPTDFWTPTFIGTFR